MGCCARLAPALLLHVNLLLCMVGGAGLATAARLKWDPSTYVPLRALLPAEYRAAAAALSAASAALLALAQLSPAALLLPAPHRARRPLLLSYAAGMVALTGLELAWAAWTGLRLAAWLRSEAAAPALELLDLRDHLRPFLVFLAHYHPLPDRLNELIEEAEADAPCNLYVGAAVLLLTALLQPLAALLALLCARSARSAVAPTSAPDSISYSAASTASERAPLALRTAYKDGRLVIL